jgi:hypothetical protein
VATDAAPEIVNVEVPKSPLNVAEPPRTEKLDEEMDEGVMVAVPPVTVKPACAKEPENTKVPALHTQSQKNRNRIPFPGY